MTGLESAILRKLEATAKDCQITYQIRAEDLGSNDPMNIDSLEFMSLLIELQEEFGVRISDEEVQQKKLKVLSNLVAYLANAQRAER